MRRFALVLAVAAVAAPVAQATSYDDRPGGTVAQATSSEDRPGNAQLRYFVPPPGTVVGSEPLDTFERWAKNHSPAPTPQGSPEGEALGRYAESLVGDSTSAGEPVRQSPRGLSSPQVAETGFQWDDAAIGGGFALGLMLLGGAAFLATRHISRPATA
jgi:hypothetical protein